MDGLEKVIHSFIFQLYLFLMGRGKKRKGGRKETRKEDITDAQCSTLTETWQKSQQNPLPEIVTALLRVLPPCLGPVQAQSPPLACCPLRQSLSLSLSGAFLFCHAPTGWVLVGVDAVKSSEEGQDGWADALHACRWGKL